MEGWAFCAGRSAAWLRSNSRDDCSWNSSNRSVGESRQPTPSKALGQVTHLQDHIWLANGGVRADKAQLKHRHALMACPTHGHRYVERSLMLVAMPHPCVQPAMVNLCPEPKSPFDHYHQVMLKGFGKSRLQFVERCLRQVIRR